MPTDLATSTLLQALEATSPRHTGVRTPWRSGAIHAAVLALWLALLLAAFGLGGVLAWSMGLAWLAYDTAQLLMTLRASLNLVSVTPLAGTGSGTHTTIPARTQPITLGVIVASHNEAMVLPITLAALLTQSQPPDQIVIADDGSDDGTAELLVRRYGLTVPPLGGLSAASTAWPTLRWLRLPHGGKARALNAAIVRLDTDTVLTVDADTLLEPDALAEVRLAFVANDRLVATTGVLHPVCAPGWQGQTMQWFQTYEYMRNFLSRHAWMRADGLLLISGAFGGFRREAVLAVGGFDPDCLVEDYELVHRLRRHSALHGLAWTTGVLGRARARTEAPSTMVSFVRQRRRWFGGFLQTQCWYRDMVGNARYGRVGTRMLPVKAIDTLQPWFGLTAVGLLVWNVASGRFSVVLPVAAVVAIKLLVDLAFRCWSVHAYRRWVGDASSVRMGAGVLAAVVEPFSFQILCQASAVAGWWLFLSGRMRWGAQQRVARLSDSQRLAVPEQSSL